ARERVRVPPAAAARVLPRPLRRHVRARAGRVRRGRRGRARAARRRRRWTAGGRARGRGEALARGATDRDAQRGAFVSGTMPAAVFAGVGRLEVAAHSLPSLVAPTDVVLDVEACGICGTDLQILSDPPGHPATVGVVIGHEFAGVVAEAGPDADLEPGDRVVV